MNDTEQTREISSLKAFFDDQLEHLQRLVSNVGNHIQEERRQALEEKRIVEKFVETSNSKMRAVDDYAPKLNKYVQILYEYILQIVDEIPPAIDLNLNAFGTNAIVNALFVNSKAIDELINNNPDMNAFLRTHSKEQVPIVYALLSAQKSEKQTLGMGMQGDMLIRDVPQQVINFSTYKIHTPCASSAELNTALKEHLFTRVLELIKQDMAAYDSKQSFNANNSYQSKVNSLANPDVYLDRLIKEIENPADLLSIQKIHFKLSKLGVKLEDDDTQSANEFDIYEINWRDNLKVVVLQITYTR